MSPYLKGYLVFFYFLLKKQNKKTPKPSSQRVLGKSEAGPLFVCMYRSYLLSNKNIASRAYEALPTVSYPLLSSLSIQHLEATASHAHCHTSWLIHNSVVICHRTRDFHTTVSGVTHWAIQRLCRAHFLCFCSVFWWKQKKEGKTPHVCNGSLHIANCDFRFYYFRFHSMKWLGWQDKQESRCFFCTTRSSAESPLALQERQERCHVTVPLCRRGEEKMFTNFFLTITNKVPYGILALCLPLCISLLQQFGSCFLSTQEAGITTNLQQQRNQRT